MSMQTGINRHITPNFLANKYKFYPQQKIVRISTDKEPLSGNEPVLVYEGEEYPMEKKRGFYSSEVFFEYSPSVDYSIRYSDSDIETHNINCKKFGEVSSYALSKLCRQPLVHTIKPGKTVARIVCLGDDLGKHDLEEMDEPFVIVSPHLTRRKIINPNLVGIISTADDFGALVHHSSAIRQYLDVCASLHDPKLIKRLESLDREKVEIDLKQDSIRFNKTDKPFDTERSTPHINIPILKPCDRILTSKEYTPDVIGNKAVNLRKLEVLNEQGKIDVIIPKSIALPNGYIKKIQALTPNQKQRFLEDPKHYISEENVFDCYNPEIHEKAIDDFICQVKEFGIDPYHIICRSAYNDEDLPDYSIPGLYHSTDVIPYECGENAYKQDLYNTIKNVAAAKWLLEPIRTRRKFNIPDEIVKPGILIQENIDADYVYTLYTNMGDNKVKIELVQSGDKVFNKNDCYPHVFTYDRDTDELSYDSIRLYELGTEFDEAGNIIGIDKPDDDLTNNEKIFNQLKRVVQNALVVEKEFGAPQDIEGGIKGDDIYFWQARNIIKPMK